MEHLCPTAAILVIHLLGMLSSTARCQEPGASLILSAKVCLCLVCSWFLEFTTHQVWWWQNQNWAEEMCSHANIHILLWEKIKSSERYMGQNLSSKIFCSEH